MWVDTQVYYEDLESISNDLNIPWASFHKKTILITGATGLIGQNLIGAITYACAKHKVQARVLALVRDIKKAKKLFAGLLNEHACLSFVVGDICTLPVITEEINYIIHGASITASEAFINKPVETVKTAIYGTANILDLAKDKKVESMVYLSSMEVYGAPTQRKSIKEEEPMQVELLGVRNCYPESKRMAENLCVSYAAEYNVDVKIARLTQTFGPGIEKADRRVFAQFAQAVQNDEDIVLQTEGKSERMYVYTMDAVSALLLLLLKGEKANAYNVANKETYCSIKEMAEMVAQTINPDKNLQVTIRKAGEKETAHFSPDHFMFLDTSKLEALGWQPIVGLPEMYRRMIKAM